jgi:serine protease Do
MRVLGLALVVAACGQDNLAGVNKGDAAGAVTRAGALAQVRNATFADVAEAVMPGVVSIASEREPQRGEGMPFSGDPFHHFFGLPGPDGSPSVPQEGLGSGVVVTADGLVLTNNHVVENSSSLFVTLADGRTLDAEVVGTDPKSDLAVIRLLGKPRDLHPLDLGDSSRIRLGDVVLAVGNPFGVGQTVTMGIVSAKGRANLGIADFEDFIQTDAAINPGNSGGPLVSASGQVIGINTAILSRTGSSIGIGFAIPSTMAREIMRALVEDGRVVRGWLGVAIQDVDRDLAKGLGLSQDQGVLVSDVSPNSPAARARLERGDLITAIDGTAVTSTGQLRNAIARAGAGARMRLRVARAARSFDVPVTLGELPTEPDEQEVVPPREPHLLGLEVAPLDEASRRRFGVPGAERGVLVTGVARGSSAARAGIQAGDVILQVNRQAVTSPQEFVRQMQKSGDAIALLVSRQGTTVYIPLRK